MIDFKELEKIVKFCRKMGVLSLKTGEFDITLGNENRPESYYKRKKTSTEDTTTTSDIIETDELTDEQVLMWSVQEGLNG